MLSHKSLSRSHLIQAVENHLQVNANFPAKPGKCQAGRQMLPELLYKQRGLGWKPTSCSSASGALSADGVSGTTGGLAAHGDSCWGTPSLVGPQALGHKQIPTKYIKAANILCYRPCQIPLLLLPSPPGTSGSVCSPPTSRNHQGQGLCILFMPHGLGP